MNEDYFCKYWLRFPSKLDAKLCSSYFSIEDLQRLIVCELNTKRRKKLLNRLVGRMYKLKRQQAWKAILKILEEKNANSREGDRDILTRAS
jgi:hypothetical protein